MADPQSELDDEAKRAEEAKREEAERRRAEGLSDELARKYDPERLLKLVANRAGRGTPLEQSVRSKYEKRFGVDLGHVRVFSGEFAEEFNRQRNAYAVTVGGTGMILMGGSAERTMQSPQGQALLAHELTHVAQQAKGLHRSAVGGMPFAEEHEVEAEQVEQQVQQELQRTPKADADARQKAEEKLAQDLETIAERVMEMFGDQARNHGTRGSFPSRRA